MTEAPLFANDNTCKDCKVKFGLLKRQHHCRNCGGSVCDKCSTKTAPIPKFNYVDPVRVCEGCYKTLTTKPAPKAAPKAEPKKQAKPESTPVPEPVHVPPPKVVNCTCGMPLCICAPEETPEPEVCKPVQKEKTEEKREEKKTTPTTTFTSSSSSFFSGFGGSSTTKWNLKGSQNELDEQCRDACKSKDLNGVRTLLDAGANAKFVDKTGNTLLHLAAMFDNFAVVELLVQRGADLRAKNPAGESPMDVATPASRRKMEALAK
mmetsp:Transcript_23627/g.33329  ORF Transcript_23627/g.33329 Transcript_23627/m.33329 type:complete len:263 (-) Transcript_23627:107-895(-)